MLLGMFELEIGADFELLLPEKIVSAVFSRDERGILRIVVPCLNENIGAIYSAKIEKSGVFHLPETLRDALCAQPGVKITLYGFGDYIELRRTEEG